MVHVKLLSDGLLKHLHSFSKQNTMTKEQLLQSAKDEAAREYGHRGYSDIQYLIPTEVEKIIDRAMEIYSSQQQAYWEQRCKLAEKCLEESPCDPDITKGQIDAWHNYHNFIKTTKP